MSASNPRPEKKTPYLLIDGYNLIQAIPSIARFVATDLKRARELLLMKLSAYAFRNQVKITVVFDGQAGVFPAENPRFGLTIIFTRGQKADQKIKELAVKISRKKDWLVITSDFDIRFQVEGSGIKSRSAREFVAELEPSLNPKKTPARGALSHRAEEKELTRKDLDWAYEVFLKNKKGQKE